MTAEETAWLTDAMLRSGERVDLSDIPGIKVGKHSTGGVGDKVSIVLAPLGGGLRRDRADDVGPRPRRTPAARSTSSSRFPASASTCRSTSSRRRCATSARPSSARPRRWRPADKKLYALRDVTGTVESIPLIASSIMSKKLAEGSDALVLDVKCGDGAFMKDEAQAPGAGRDDGRDCHAAPASAPRRSSPTWTRRSAAPIGNASRSSSASTR